MTVNRSDFQKGRLASVSAADTIIVNDEDGTLEPQVIDFAGLAASAPFTGAFWPNSSTALTGAGLANDDRIPVLDGSVPKYITADQLAQMPQLSSRYVPTSGDAFFVGSGGFENRSGASNSNVAAEFPAWAFGANTDASVGTFVYVPSWWATYHVDIVWAIDAVASGDVVFTLRRDDATDGQNLATGNTVDNLTATAAGQYISKHSRIATSSTLAIGKVMGLNVIRDADNVADTLNADCKFIGVLLTRAS